MALSCSKKLSVLSRRIPSKHHGNFYCLNCLHSLATGNKRESQENVFEKKKDFCNTVMPSEDTKILEFNQYQKSDKAPFVICSDLECLIKKIDGSKNNPENSFTAKVGKHIPSRFSICTMLSFKSIENKYDVYRGKGCRKKFCESLRELAIKIINFKEKTMKLLRKEPHKSSENSKICYICEEKNKDKHAKDIINLGAIAIILFCA